MHFRVHGFAVWDFALSFILVKGLARLASNRWVYGHIGSYFHGYRRLYVHMHRYVYMYTHIYTQWIHDLMGVKGFRGVICGCEAWQWKSCMQGVWRRCGLGSRACVPCFAAWCLCLARCSRVRRVLGCKLDFKRCSFICN